MSNKTSNLCVRIEPSVKQEAEEILATLGISASSAITMFYKQIILKKGLPFSVRVPNKPIAMGSLSEEELAKEIHKGLDDIENGRTEPIEKVLDDFHKKYGL